MHSNTHVYTVPHILNWLWLFLRNTYDIKLPALAVGLQQLGIQLTQVPAGARA